MNTTELWAHTERFQPQIVAFVLTVALGIATHFLKPRVKLIFGRANNSFHVIKHDDSVANIYCEKLFVQNVGRKPAEKVEVTIICPPTDFKVYPPQKVDSNINNEGALVVQIPFISPGELIIIDTIHINNQVSDVKFVRSPDATGTPVHFEVTQKHGRLKLGFVALIMLLGAFYGVQLVLSAFSIFGSRP